MAKEKKWHWYNRLTLKGRQEYEAWQKEQLELMKAEKEERRRARTAAAVKDPEEPNIHEWIMTHTNIERPVSWIGKSAQFWVFTFFILASIIAVGALAFEVAVLGYSSTSPVTVGTAGAYFIVFVGLFLYFFYGKRKYGQRDKNTRIIDSDITSPSGAYYVGDFERLKSWRKVPLSSGDLTVIKDKAVAGASTDEKQHIEEVFSDFSQYDYMFQPGKNGKGGKVKGKVKRILKKDPVTCWRFQFAGEDMKPHFWSRSRRMPGDLIEFAVHAGSLEDVSVWFDSYSYNGFSKEEVKRMRLSLVELGFIKRQIRDVQTSAYMTDYVPLFGVRNMPFGMRQYTWTTEKEAIIKTCEVLSVADHFKHIIISKDTHIAQVEAERDEAEHVAKREFIPKVMRAIDETGGASVNPQSTENPGTETPKQSMPRWAKIALIAMATTLGIAIGVAILF